LSAGLARRGTRIQPMAVPMGAAVGTTAVAAAEPTFIGIRPFRGPAEAGHPNSTDRGQPIQRRIVSSLPAGAGGTEATPGRAKPRAVTPARRVLTASPRTTPDINRRDSCTAAAMAPP